MTETYQEKVARFIDFNKEMIVSAVTDNNLKEQGVNAKLLLCSIIDSLAKSRFPDISGNGKRFRRTIESSANWKDCDRISLLHLKRAIEVLSNDARFFAGLSERVDAVVQRNFKTDNQSLPADVPIEKDLEENDILEFWPRDAKKSCIKLGSISWEMLTHKSLFWQYRNSLVHEYRIPGKAIELGVPKSEPFYQHVTQVHGDGREVGISFTNSWELLYPTGFFQKIAENILEEVAAYHLLEKTSPFGAYSDGTFWIPTFNE